MKYIILFSILFLIGFNNPQIGGIENGKDCPLNELKRTVEYKKEIEKVRSLKKDTIVALESIKLNDIKYSSVMDIKENENHVWFIVESKTENDSILINYSDYVEYFQEINTRFDLENCQLIIETIYSTEEELDSKSVDIVNL
ncbi:hypothetical protein [Namhaeicola litoreus]|uniref:Intein N-terminal splicing region n=1 Tax=Namhaeicola litoreus TaxID=1052145 RepID=A0ABW3Y4B7_9FLAO